MRGTNPLRVPESGDGEHLFVQEIFLTIQGEGPYIGKPAYFIRLGGCNLACEFCDTEFESFTKMSLKEIIGEIDKINHSTKRQQKLVVITGGEPFRQPIEKLCECLIGLNYEVQIETNGTLYRRIHKDVKIVCSPKNTGHGYHQIREDLLERIDAIKFLVSSSNLLYQDIGDVGQNKFKIPVYIQPMDEYDDIKNNKNIEVAKNLAMKYDFNLSVQLHKMIGMK